ncbi:trichohyalin isoform X2 [Clupea harengus]|uniref:Trichohyalin isoform X2 n=1 Tax=Clupea harengus TaxID=7950 RepID=A0A8M1KNG5_CLUHA|nr:trichohyalin isoform X2 [Clupea harengus]
MEESNYNGQAGEDGEDTDELLCTGAELTLFSHAWSSSRYAQPCTRISASNLCYALTDEAYNGRLASSALPRDHCDLLLDAIDAELSRLQSQNLSHDGNFKTEDVKGLAYLCGSPSLSKDTGLGSTSPTNDKEYQDAPSHGPEGTPPIRSPSKASGGWKDSARRSEREGSSVTLDSRTEQCHWRLERLLGRADRGPLISTPPAPDSVCTEDFTERFKDETVDLDEKSRTESSRSTPHDTAALSGPPSNTGATEPAAENTSLPLGTNVRYLAGVPVKYFDAVTIDSDLDSVRTEQVHRHLHRSFSHRKATKAVEQMDSMCSDHSGCDTQAEEGSQQYGTLASRATVSSCGRQRIENSSHSRGQMFSSDDNSEESESFQHSRNGHKGTRHPSSTHRRPRANRVKRIRGNNFSSGWMEEQVTGRRLLEETLSALRKANEREENTLVMKRAQLCETEQSLTELLQQRQCVSQQLELLRLEVEQNERDGQWFQASLRDNTAQADASRRELQRLQSQRDSCQLEVTALQEELDTLQRSRTVLQEGGETRRLSGSVSVLEREAMDRLLENAKSALFTEQRRFRHTLDSMSERLDEAQQELDQREEELRTLRRRCTELEAQLTDTNRQRGEQEEHLQRQLKDQEGRVGALERIVAQKEVLLLGVQEQKSALQLELGSQKEECHKQCTQIQEHGEREKEVALEAQGLQLSLAHEKELQQVRLQGQEVKSAALREQAQSHTQRVESLESCIQLKEEEVRRLTETQEKQEEAMGRREKQLRGETEEKVQQALKQEQRRWEEQREVTLQDQWRRMKREEQEAVESVRAEAERERRNALGLHSKVLELQTKVQTLEDKLCLQQREQSSAQAAVTQALREEHQAELQRLRRQTEEEAQREGLRLRHVLQQSEAQLHSSQVTRAEQEHDHQMVLERLEQQQRRWARDLQVECQNLQVMLGNGEHTELIGNTLLSYTLGQAVEMVPTLRQQFQKLITGLQQELELQKHTNQKIGQDKEHELHLQREQMLLEKERALQSLRERLIQEHIEELSILNRSQLRGAPEGSVMDSLRRQLRDKDEELRHVQRSMGQWKEKTAARLARKFEEELTSELERRTPRVCSDREKKLQRLEEEMRQLTMCADLENMPSATPPSSKSADPPATLRSQDLASYKLLRHLQSRIRQLHAENRPHKHSPPHQPSRPAELAGSYLETIPATRESSFVATQK